MQFAHAAKINCRRSKEGASSWQFWRRPTTIVRGNMGRRSPITSFMGSHNVLDRHYYLRSSPPWLSLSQSDCALTMADTNGTVIVDGKPYFGPIGETSNQILLEKTFMASGYLTGVGFGKFNQRRMIVTKVNWPWPMYIRYSTCGLWCLLAKPFETECQEHIYILPHGVHYTIMSHEWRMVCNIRIWSTIDIHRQSKLPRGRVIRVFASRVFWS